MPRGTERQRDRRKPMAQPGTAAQDRRETVSRVLAGRRPSQEVARWVDSPQSEPHHRRPFIPPAAFAGREGWEGTGESYAAVPMYYAPKEWFI